MGSSKFNVALDYDYTQDFFPKTMQSYRTQLQY